MAEDMADVMAKSGKRRDEGSAEADAEADILRRAAKRRFREARQQPAAASC